MRPTHPGEFLSRELQSRGRTQKYFAELIEKTPEEVSYLIAGKRNFTMDIALRVGYALGTSYEVWLGLQNDYDAFLLKHSEKQSVFDRIKERAINLGYYKEPAYA